ncbi:hypothetical protein PI125_g18559 [Phytophthora idaei]|nr:hypothetical protein PI125_g18559 [Phytophthora idaei]
MTTGLWCAIPVAAIERKIDPEDVLYNRMLSTIHDMSKLDE